MYTRKGLVLCAVLLTAAIALTALAPVLPAHAEGGAPVAQNLELTTYRNVSVGGRLSAVDPDGGTLTYQITTEPTKGEIELTDDGRFVYTPGTNRRGRDYFGFKATDADGNSSQEATVIIRIEKQKTRTTYSDLDGNPSAYAATMLAEEGIFVGSPLGGSYVFEPDREVKMCIRDREIRSVVRKQLLEQTLHLCAGKSFDKLLTQIVVHVAESLRSFWLIEYAENHRQFSVVQLREQLCQVHRVIHVQHVMDRPQPFLLEKGLEHIYSHSHKMCIRDGR